MADPADRRVSFPAVLDQPPPPFTSQADRMTTSPPTTPNVHPVPPGPDPMRGDAQTEGARRRANRQVTLDTPANIGSRRPTSESQRSTRRQSTDPNAGVLRRMTTGLLTPERKIGRAPTFFASFKAAVFSSWLNILLVFIPISWALHFVHAAGNEKITDTAIFVTSFIAIIPLAGLLGFATEEAALRLGQTLGGLLNATLGNVVELIVAILALVKCELAVVQSSLVGSILSNLLLVLGMCFFAGGVRFSEQVIKGTAAQLNASLLLIAVIAVLIPSAFHFSVNDTTSGNGNLTDAKEGSDLLSMSHGVAILLLLLYIGYLLFQMFTHAALYKDDVVSSSTNYGPEVTNVSDRMRIPEKFRHFRSQKKVDEETGIAPTTTSTESTVTNGDEGVVGENGNGVVNGDTHEEDEEEVPQMNIWSTVIVMVADAVLVGVTAEFLVDSINGLVTSHPSLSAEWVGLILLPIVGNAAEHFTAVSVSVKDKIDLSISVAVGSSIQIALFVIPVIQLLAWTIGKPMTLLFDPYESIVLFFTVLIVNQTLADGRSNWMEGLVLMMLYLIIAVSFWYYPGSNTATLLGC
ncbi:hypothetical protein TREMEDRAFT_28850 [Tremella mesenterica DSM 1558]|uniref:uncharacterized protein n=1 Tax=Tremella mesenterica (strain ATCC 24925 / CBS 8224 / DSM 1558 / NBRC 9311 / NRRL Y-6157 / RJB 2259-6 / UBC 559-6) TaxID=578456 RepID=UPI0003F48CB2|nr:uncharacterized protein TREMEDRAFT_28850 [Tremella mesenterica DSM 1558]EIW70946.1 hypothetical protein TREMEDRAFT_28850 [Tremella mesenterica DSM 1558]